MDALTGSDPNVVVHEHEDEHEHDHEHVNAHVNVLTCYGTTKLSGRDSRRPLAWEWERALSTAWA